MMDINCILRCNIKRDKAMKAYKAYFKILLITTAIQIACFAISKSVAGILRSTSDEVLGEVIIIGMAIGLFLSITISVILAFKWVKTIKGRLACIFLMPTNYTWILALLEVAWIVKVIGYMLEGLAKTH